MRNLGFRVDVDCCRNSGDSGGGGDGESIPVASHFSTSVQHTLPEAVCTCGMLLFYKVYEINEANYYEYKITI